MGAPHAEWQGRIKNRVKLELGEYIMEQYKKTASALSEDDINQWVLGWYMERFGKSPPMWLTGSRPMPTPIEDGG